MPRKAAVTDSIYLDEAEGFILEHSILSPPRAWSSMQTSPLSSTSRLAASRKKMDWEEEVRTHPDEPLPDYPIRKRESIGGAQPYGDDDAEDDANKERCVICLMALRDRTIVGVCGHEFCFECIGVWANQSRRCPLCSADMAPFLLHDLDASTPTKFYLPPLPTRRFPSSSLPGPSTNRLPPVQRQRQLAREEKEKEEPDELELQVERRREIYRHELYVKHIGSNPATRFRPSPTPRQIAEDPALIQRATAFLRRELRVWTMVDVEFLTTYIISLLKTIDIRSEPAIRLLADFLDPNAEYSRSAEHFAHELYSFLRCPYKEWRKWDEVAQYDPVPSPRSDRSRSRSPSRSLSPFSDLSRRSRSPSSSRSESRSRSPSRDRDRKWARRDTFVPSLSPDAKRWDEHDTWLDPEYAAWLNEERKRDETRRERKRRRASELDLPARPKAMRAWGKGPVGDATGLKRVKVELLPDDNEHLLRMDEVVEEPEEMDQDQKPNLDDAPGQVPGLSIRGAARSIDVPAAPRRLTLLERLAKAKAEGITSVSASASAPAPPANAGPSTAVKSSLEAKRSSIVERLAKAKVEARSQSQAQSQSQDQGQAQATALLTSPRIDNSDDPSAPLDVISGADAESDGKRSPPKVPHSISDPTTLSASGNTAHAHAQGQGLRATARARLALKMKLESEKAAFRQAAFESKAQELRHRLLQARARREADEVASNYHGMGMDRTLRTMDSEERKSEVRRRLMRLKIIEAETEGERKTRELKEKLLARKNGAAPAA